MKNDLKLLKLFFLFVSTAGVLGAFCGISGRGNILDKSGGSWPANLPVERTNPSKVGRVIRHRLTEKLNVYYLLIHLFF